MNNTRRLLITIINMHIRLRPKELVCNEKVNKYDNIRHAGLHPKITNEQCKENTKYNYKYANQAPPETISIRPKKRFTIFRLPQETNAIRDIATLCAEKHTYISLFSMQNRIHCATFARMLFKNHRFVNSNFGTLK